MRGGNAQRAQYLGDRLEVPGHRRTTRSTTRAGPAGDRTESVFIELREARKAKRGEVYKRRRFIAVSLLVLGAVALIFAVFVQTKAANTAARAVPIDPNKAGPATVLAEAAGVGISTPIRPVSLTGIGYHPEGETLTAMEPRGENLSANVVLGLLSRGETPEKINYYVMDAAGRGGPQTGAVDVGATTGTTVYTPVSGTVTAIRPDPMVQNANVIEIKPAANPDVRVSVALVRSDGEAGVNDEVKAGKTELGTVADSAEVLDPQLSSYTADAGNHVTITVSESG
jgi:hypothetical protein